MAKLAAANLKCISIQEQECIDMIKTSILSTMRNVLDHRDTVHLKPVGDPHTKMLVFISDDSIVHHFSLTKIFYSSKTRTEGLFENAYRASTMGPYNQNTRKEATFDVLKSSVQEWKTILVKGRGEHVGDVTFYQTFHYHFTPFWDFFMGVLLP